MILLLALLILSLAGGMGTVELTLWTALVVLSIVGVPVAYYWAFRRPGAPTLA